LHSRARASLITLCGSGSTTEVAAAQPRSVCGLLRHVMQQRDQHAGSHGLPSAHRLAGARCSESEASVRWGRQRVVSGRVWDDGNESTSRVFYIVLFFPPPFWEESLFG
jgi:hypothetical protein